MRPDPVGRTAVVDELSAWLERADMSDAVRLVIGGRGAGKSRCLARVADAADTAVPERPRPPSDGRRPERTAVGAADATGATEGEWLRSLAEAMGVGGELDGDADYAQLSRALEAFDRPRAVVLSGAPGRLRATSSRRDVPQLVRALLAPATTGRDGSGYSALMLAEVGSEALAGLLERHPRLARSVIDLDAPPYAPERTAFEAWVRGLLEVPDSAYADRPADAAAAAAEVTAAAWPNFLLAEVLALEIRVRGTAEPGLPRTLREAWEYVMSAFGPAEPRMRQLLAPLVMAEGVLGMPDDLRVRAASAVRGRDVAPEELHRAEAAVEAFAVHEPAADPAVGGGQTVRHARLREAALADAAEAAYGTDAAEVQRRLATAVRARIPEDVAAVAAGRAPDPAESYALRHGIGHALAGGVLDDWLADVRVLALGDPQALAEAVAAADRDGRAPIGAAAARRRGAVAEAVRLYRYDARCTVAEWVSRLRFAAQAWGDQDLVVLLDGLGLPLPWRADWARWRPLEAFDPRAFAPGWTGPVEVAAVRAGEDGVGGEVCLRSSYDGLHRWYELSGGARTGEAGAGAPTGARPAHQPATGPDGAPAPEVVDDFDLLKVRIGGPGSTRVHALCTPYPGAQAYPLADGRLLLAGHSGAAVVSFDPTAPAPAPQPWTTEANLLPPEDRWTGTPREAGDLTRYHHGGAVRADRERLGAVGLPPEAADLLCTVGLPAYPVFWQRTADCLAAPRTLAEHVAEEGGNPPSDGAALTVLAISADDGTPLCVEHATGRVVQAETSEPDPVNSSVAAFAACQALASWALAVSTARQVPERYAFLDFLRAALTRIDPEAAADGGSDWWWFQAVGDETSYTLYA